ncbi:hypothetical protein [Sinosporangium siamense]|uniref:Uncharacterized protein n=1 Tax=Sinosporangium siamense TaxID=1367973 RepID=A0A919RBM2_9ACTN|nr:hypothetical protein [Sinosporangium siamense]GII90492.1 hypothetical protein Ssi02_07230 [Sinosporangium siamense]
MRLSPVKPHRHTFRTADHGTPNPRVIEEEPKRLIEVPGNSAAGSARAMSGSRAAKA